MKLLDRVALEISVWPAAIGRFHQDETGDLIGSGGFGYQEFHGKYPLSDDRLTAVVTRAQWEAERARIAQEEDDRMLAKHKAGADELERLHAETEREAEDWRNECQKQYEQELWDKVAERVFCMAFVDGLSGWDTVGFEQESKRAMTAADAFMAERAKRLKK